jgi:hypothetical protein
VAGRTNAIILYLFGDWRILVACGWKGQMQATGHKNQKQSMDGSVTAYQLIFY